MIRKTLTLAAILCAFVLASTPAYAYINRGEVLISGASSVSLTAGGEASITVDPYQDRQLSGCGSADCPAICGEEDCVRIVDGGNARSNNINCSCSVSGEQGVNEALELFTADVRVVSADAKIATAAYDEKGVVTIKGVGAGTTTVNISAALREWSQAEKVVTVTVTGGSSGGASGGNSGGTAGGGGGASGGSSGGASPAAPAAPAAATPAAVSTSPAQTPAAASYTVPPATLNVRFADVSGWASESIYYLANRGIVSGRTDSDFAPNDRITRAEFVKIITGVAGAEPPTGGALQFEDVPAGAWYAPFVAWAAENGVVTGSGGTFRPSDNISRQDMAVIIHRLLGNVILQELPAAAQAGSFADESQIGTYAADAVRALRQAGVVNGKDGDRFAPNDNATRAEAAKMLAGVMQALGGQNQSGNE
jgi:hypothetical protein